MDNELYELSKKEKNYLFYEVFKLKYPKSAEYICNNENPYITNFHNHTKIIVENIYWIYDPKDNLIKNAYKFPTQHYVFLPHRAGDTELYSQAYGIYLILQKDDEMKVNMEFYKKNNYERNGAETDYYERFSFKRQTELKEHDTFFVDEYQYHKLSVPKIEFDGIKPKSRKYFWCMAFFIGLN